MKRIVVLGGTGFLGSFVCKHAVKRGCTVISVSRRGGAPAGPEWTRSVEYLSYDVLREDPRALFSQLGLERTDSSTYNRFEDGPRPPVQTAIISTAGQLVDSSWPRPIQAVYAALKKKSLVSSADVQSYEEVNRDLHIRVAMAASETMDIDSFVYISSALPNFVQERIPFMERYHTTRRETETFLEELSTTSDFRSVALRPTIIFDGQNSAHFQTMPLATVSAFSSLTDALIFDRLNVSIPHLLPTPPVSADFVAECAVEAALNPGVAGNLDVAEMTRLTDSIVL